jgi:hypothetical protein
VNRRSFLTRLASGVVGLSLVDVEWMPGAIERTIAATGELTDIDQIAAEILRRMVARAPDLRGRFVPGDYRLGMPGMTDQFSVECLPYKDGMLPERDLEPAAAVLVNYLNDKQLTSFGALPIPRGDYEGAVATDAGTGLTVRAIRIYDIGIEYPHEAGWRHRFDILGGMLS